MNLSNFNLKKAKGFTLIELLVVIAILAVLLSITLIAINPARQFAQANNTQRRSDVSTLLNAINQYMIDNNGDTPTGVSACTSSAPCTLSNDSGIAGRLDICSALVSQYVAALPVDPTDGTGSPVSDCSTGTYNTGYTIYRGSDNRLTVAAPGAELSETIQVTR